jgi:site-specific DNA recombinase
MPKPPSPAKRVPAFYARFSSDQQNPASVDDQLTRLRGYLDRSGESTDGVRVFSDSAVSGSMWKSRPGIQQLLYAVKRKEISCVYAEAVDRISRDPGDLAEFKKILAFYDTSFVSVSEGLKLDGSANAGTLFMLRSFTAEQSVAATADKAQRGLRANAEARRTTGGRTYGYARTKIGESRKGTAIRQNDIDREQAAVVVQIFTMYATGLGYSAIAAALNAQGTPPPQRARGAGGGWVSSCVREMLRNPRYIGDWSFGKREWARDPETRKRVVRRLRDVNDPAHPADRERLVEAHFPELAIVEPELWERVQARVETHTERFARREVSDRKSSYLLSGLLRCGVCGSQMAIAGGTIPRYRCSANAKRGTCSNSLSVREPELREGIVASIAKVFSAPESVAAWEDRARKYLQAEAAGADSRLAAIKGELAELDARISLNDDRLKKLYLRWADGEGGDTLEQLVKELRTGLEIDRAKVSALNAEASAGEVGRMPTAEEVAETARYVTSLGFLNELDQEFADSEPYEVRVANCREGLRTFFRGGHITLTPLPDERVYLAELVVLPMLPPGDKRRTPQPAVEAYDIRGCAGRI